MLGKLISVLTTIAVMTGLTPALAQNIPNATADSNPVPKTVWQIDDNGTALHQASQLQCPATVGEFHRTRLNLFGLFGLDVGCDYQDVDHNEITLFIALHPNQEITKEFDSAKAALVQRAPNATPLAENEQQTFTSTLGWQHLIYRLNGASRTGVWMTRLGGWNVEYRATFAANRTDAALETLTLMTDTVVKTAGAHIASCQTLMPLQRQGQKNTNQSMFPALSISGTLAAKDARLNPAVTPNWCIVQPIMVENLRFLFWRNVANQNGGLVERLTPVLDNDPVIS